MRRLLPFATVLLIGAACTSFKGEGDPAGGDGGTPSGEGGVEAGADASDDGQRLDDGGTAPKCAGQPIEATGFEKFPPDGWSENDVPNLLDLDGSKHTAGGFSLRAGPYKTSGRSMISRIVDLGASMKTKTFCLSLDLAITWVPSATGYVELLQVNLFPGNNADDAYIGLGVNSDGVFVHFIGVGGAGDQVRKVSAAVATDLGFHRWTFTADANGLSAWRDGTRVAHDDFPLPAFQKVDLSVGATGGDESPRPNVTVWADELAATLLP